MKFEQLYSSDYGHLYVVTSRRGKRLLIECGVAWEELVKAIGNRKADIEGCLLTHEHEASSRAVKDVMAAGIDVYASGGTFYALGVKDKRAVVVEKGDLIRLMESFEVLAFEGCHDCAEPLGFVVRCDNEFLLFDAGDTGRISRPFKVPFAILALENAGMVEYLKKSCDRSQCREVHLINLSGDNAARRSIRDEFQDRFSIKTIVLAEADDSPATVCGGMEARKDAAAPVAITKEGPGT